MRRERSSGAKAEGHLLQWKAGICKDESVKAKREERPDEQAREHLFHLT